MMKLKSWLSALILTCALPVFAADDLGIENYNMQLKTIKGYSPTDVSRIHPFFAKFPFQYSFKKTVGNGEKMAILFVDANCPYCMRQNDYFGKTNAVNMTFYIFPVDIYHVGNGINEHIWCSENPAEYYDSWMRYYRENLNQGAMVAAETWKKENPSKECKTPIAYNRILLETFFAKKAFDGQFQIETPTFLFSDGRQHSKIIIEDSSWDKIQRSMTTMAKGTEFMATPKVLGKFDEVQSFYLEDLKRKSQ